ncbi:jg416, partial [Pararge aegeria aegeria]
MPKNITNEVRDIILKVKEFMDEEKRMQVPIIPLSKVYVRVSAATGVSERTVLNIVKEARLVEQGLLDPDTLKRAPKKRVRTKGKIEVSEFDLQVIRRKIHEFYAFKKEVPTINKLLQILRDDI